MPSKADSYILYGNHCELKWSLNHLYQYLYCWNAPEPTILDSPSLTPEPTYTGVQPFPDPSPSQTFPLPEPSVLPSATLQPTPIVPSEIIPPIIEPTSNSITQDVNYVTLDNGVKLTKKEAIEVILLQNTSNLVKKIFTNPKEAFKALGSVGKDMPPKKRKKAQQVVFPVIIVSSVVTSTNNLLIRRRVK